MKKNRLYNLFLVIGLFCSLFLCCNFKVFPVSATISSPDVTKSNYAEYDFDENLFNAVLAIAKQLNCNQPLLGRGFDLDLFLVNSNDSQIPSYVSSGVGASDYQNNIDARNQIVNDLKIGKLDLTTGLNARYDCLKAVKSLQNIAGLNSMSVSFIKELVLNDNALSSLNSTDLEPFTNLETLSISNNNLANFTLNPSLTKIKSLNLSHNFLTNFDFSFLQNNSSINLSNNGIQQFYSLNFSSKNLSILDLSFNKLTGLTQENIDYLLSKASTIFLGVQGINEVDTFYAGDTIKIYNLPQENLNKLSVDIEYFEGSSTISPSEFYDDQSSNLICSSDFNGEQTIYLPAGKIKISFKNNNSDIDLIANPSFSAKIVQVKLPKLNYYLLVDGVETTKTYQEKNVNVCFCIDESLNIPNLQEVLASSKIYSRMSNYSSYSQNDNLLISTNGTFSCSCYAVFDGIESEKQAVEITRKDIKGIVLGIVTIIFIFVLVSAGYYITKWYKSGAEVAPLSDKELARINYKRNSHKKEVRENFIKGFGRERHFESMRVDGDEVLSDLNSERTECYYNSNQSDEYKDSNINQAYNFESNFEKYNTEEFKNDFDDKNLSDDIKNNEVVDDIFNNDLDEDDTEE